MIVFAAFGIIIFAVVAFIGLVCAQFNSDDLHKMGIRK